MFERFTDRARKVMALANQNAQRLNHEYIGVEHILLGIAAEGGGVACNVLRNFDVDLRKIRLEVEKLVKAGPDMIIMGRLPQTPRAKQSIMNAMEESKNLGHNYIGTEHLLLGLLRDTDGVACQVLVNLGLSLDSVREEILNTLATGDKTATTATDNPAAPPPPPSPSPSPQSCCPLSLPPLPPVQFPQPIYPSPSKLGPAMVRTKPGTPEHYHALLDQAIALSKTRGLNIVDAFGVAYNDDTFLRS